jgi:lipopolysaccharide/colanic/teichoic acid biosynthesis glycosyltransferase
MNATTEKPSRAAGSSGWPTTTSDVFHRAAVPKRVLDVAASAAGLALLAPIVAVTALAVRVGIGTPVLFRQQRPGLHGRPFEMLKFRTMLDGTDRDGNPLPDEARMTRLGRLLRSTSLDELPGLWNVLRGEMSLVGPRPLLMEYLPLYTPEQARRHDVRPGITGWAQVNGRNAIGWDEKFRLDVWYVDNRSLLLDLKILLMTVKKVFVREGISGEGQATMSRFQRGGAGDDEPVWGERGSRGAGEQGSRGAGEQGS